MDNAVRTTALSNAVNLPREFADYVDSDAYRRLMRQPSTKGARMRTYRPQIDVLEDRTVPALFRNLTPPPPPPATHLQVLAPLDVETGKPFNIVVSALDKSNHLVPTFKGTVQITLATADSGAPLPASF